LKLLLAQTVFAQVLSPPTRGRGLKHKNGDSS
jgi:hypothetical protein